MKGVFILCIALSALMISCENKTVKKMEHSPLIGDCCGSPNDTLNFMDTVAITASSANPLIDAYKAYADTLPRVDPNKPNSRSFKISANALRQYLNAEPDIDTINVYLTLQNKEISAVYIGTKPDDAGVSKIVFYHQGGDSKNPENVFDMTKPCPVCDKVGIETVNHK